MKICQKALIFYLSRFNFFPNTKLTLENCQSGEASPNVVTLLLKDTPKLKHKHPMSFLWWTQKRTNTPFNDAALSTSSRCHTDDDDDDVFTSSWENATIMIHFPPFLQGQHFKPIFRHWSATVTTTTTGATLILRHCSSLGKSLTLKLICVEISLPPLCPSFLSLNLCLFLFNRKYYNLIHSLPLCVSQMNPK